MLKRLLLICLLCMGAVALLGTQATAGCIPLAPGVKLCNGVIVFGSTDFEIRVVGVGLLPCNDKKLDPRPPCPQVSAKISGTLDAGDDLCGDGYAGDPDLGNELEDDAYDPDCDIAVTAVCGMWKCVKNPTKPGCGDPADINSAHFPSSAVPQEVLPLECLKKANCKALAEFLDENYPGLCKPGHVLIRAFATYFNGETCYCDAPFKADGSCECRNRRQIRRKHSCYCTLAITVIIRARFPEGGVARS
jgi:hypothetical protein